ncbi:MAG: YeeE/YedE family protein [Candidatus Accumulibacter sp. UW20]|jgi:uncharacterized membrane protein YedE/YeeE
MMIDWTHFTPLAALAGGALIGVAVTLFALVNGRIAGISGIIGGLLRPRPGDVGWRLAFVLGLLLAPLFYRIFGSLPETSIETGPGLIILAGLLVGLGTRYGAGCTSGHGVCGLSRRSPRSMVATLAFMATGFATVFVTRHLLT